MMNQNIQRLINDYQEILDRDPLDQMEDTQSILTRFTKLIVRECIDKIENEASAYAEPVWAVELVNDIKETFGVEE